MKMAEELQRELRSINRKSYPAYKGLKGAYQFPDYQLFIEHVQGDPFAAPSALRIFVPHSKAKFPERYYWDKCSKVALQDALLRRFAEISAKFCYQAKGSGKSGVIQVSHCGQEVLERTACEITKEGIHIRFFVGFPANGRTINSVELEKILFVYLPKCVEMSLYHRKVPERETEQVICLKEDQRVIREELKKRGLIAFVANGSILPRQSGNSDLPMKDSVPKEHGNHHTASTSWFDHRYGDQKRDHADRRRRLSWKIDAAPGTRKRRLRSHRRRWKRICDHG